MKMPLLLSRISGRGGIKQLLINLQHYCSTNRGRLVYPKILQQEGRERMSETVYLSVSEWRSLKGALL